MVITSVVLWVGSMVSWRLLCGCKKERGKGTTMKEITKATRLLDFVCKEPSEGHVRKLIATKDFESVAAAVISDNPKQAMSQLIQDENEEPIYATEDLPDEVMEEESWPERELWPVEEEGMYASEVDRGHSFDAFPIQHVNAQTIEQDTLLDEGSRVGESAFFDSRTADEVEQLPAAGTMPQWQHLPARSAWKMNPLLVRKLVERRRSVVQEWQSNPLLKLNRRQERVPGTERRSQRRPRRPKRRANFEALSAGAAGDDFGDTETARFWKPKRQADTAAKALYEKLVQRNTGPKIANLLQRYTKNLVKR